VDNFETSDLNTPIRAPRKAGAVINHAHSTWSSRGLSLFFANLCVLGTFASKVVTWLFSLRTLPLSHFRTSHRIIIPR